VRPAALAAMTTSLLFALLLWALPPPTEQTIGAATLVDGSFALTRGTTVYRGGEGVRLKYGDIIETPDGAFTQLEFTNGAVLALGPGTRAYILPAGASAAGHALSLDVVILAGWLKAETPPSKGTFRIRTPRLAVISAGGTFVVRSTPGECNVFVERATSVSLAEVKAGGDTGALTQAKADQFFLRQKTAPVSTAPRASPAFLEAMPRQFRDTLPSRLGRVSKPVEPKSERPVNYEDIDSWLKAPSAWRRGLAQRFAPRLGDANFRKRIEAHAKELPDWAPILHPDTTSESPPARN